jgi:hypothetical protein
MMTSYEHGPGCTLGAIGQCEECARRYATGKTCEICGDVVAKVVKATNCGHTVHLCETCKTECPGALRRCLSCEDGGRQ